MDNENPVTTKCKNCNKPLTDAAPGTINDNYCSMECAIGAGATSYDAATQGGGMDGGGIVAP